MKNMLKNNKKGFTLVELLAVIVILALLIVITANTVLPMMNNSKEAGLRVEAQRILNLASGQYQIEIMKDPSFSGSFTVGSLIGSEENYRGCVTVSVDSGVYKYIYTIYDVKNTYSIDNESASTAETINEVSDNTVSTSGVTVPDAGHTCP